MIENGTGASGRRVFPVNLLLDGRKALVVGGGGVALDKVRLLVQAGADVTVASPEVSEDLAKLPQESAVTLLRREFIPSDVDGILLVFAASEDRTLNARVIECCRSRGILCCSADGNWAMGDFALPVILRKDDLTVTISSGGRASRLSRMVRESLSRHIEHADSASVLVIGTSHEYLPIDRREPYHLAGQRLERTGMMLRQLVGVQEFILLNTCNRIELHAVVSDKAEMTGLLARVLGFDQLKPEEYYVKRQYDAYAHAAQLSAGLFSQSPGEYHIVAQLKDSLGYAVRAGWARGIMQEWVSTALHVSKEIRNTAGPFLKDLEIEDLCISYLEAKRSDLGNARILVLGSGVVGSTIVERLVRAGHGCDWCYHITRPELPDSWAGKVSLCTFDDLRASLFRSDVILCATDSPHLVLTREHAPLFNSGRNVLILDLTVPRNVDPTLDGSAPNLAVADLEDLKQWCARETVGMEKVFELSRRIVGEHKSLYEKLAGKLVPVG
ncbi:MAG: NAD(P)-dependent oxidoreductase [Spirochaetia bacterium]